DDGRRRAATLILPHRPAPTLVRAAGSHDALASESGEVVAREAEAAAVDLLVVLTRPRGTGARHAAWRARELGHDAGHPDGGAVGTRGGDEVLPRSHVLVRED